MTVAEIIRRSPPGWLFDVLVFAVSKRGLEGLPENAPERLRILEGMEKLTDDRLTAEVVSTIAPLSNDGYSLCEPAFALDRAGNRCEASFKIVTNANVFALLAQTDPSLIEALNQLHHPRGVVRQ